MQHLEICLTTTEARVAFQYAKISADFGRSINGRRKFSGKRSTSRVLLFHQSVRSDLKSHHSFLKMLVSTLIGWEVVKILVGNGSGTPRSSWKSYFDRTVSFHFLLVSSTGFSRLGHDGKHPRAFGHIFFAFLHCRYKMKYRSYQDSSVIKKKLIRIDFDQ